MHNEHSSILVVLVAGIGDLVLGSMGLRAIRRGIPGAEIHLLTSSEAGSLGQHYPYVDRVWTLPIRRLRQDKAVILEFVKLLLSLRRYRYDKIVNLYQVASPGGALLMGAMFSLLRSPLKIGHDRHGFGLFLDRPAPGNFFQGRHMADSMLEMACLAGGKADGSGIEVFRSGQIEPGWTDMIDFGPVQSESKTLAIHAGSDSVYKRADPGVFSGAVNRIAASFPLQTVVLGGPAERPIADHIAQGIKSRVINLAGKTSLDSLVYVLEKVDLLITNDSGPMHIAAALKKPLVALFSNGYPAVFGPYGDSIRFRILEMDRLRRFGKGSINEVAAAQVAAFGEELLRGP